VIYGVTPEYMEVRDWPIVSGRGFEPPEVSGAGKVALSARAWRSNCSAMPIR